MLVNCRCGTQLSVEQEHIGQPVRCPSCNAVFAVPGPAPAAPLSYGAQPAAALPVRGGGGAVASLVLGLIGLVGWCIPIVGLPMSITGLVLGIRGLKGPRSGYATAGIVLNGIGLLATVVNIIIGAYLGATGQHPLFNR